MMKTPLGSIFLLIWTAIGANAFTVPVAVTPKSVVVPSPLSPPKVATSRIVSRLDMSADPLGEEEVKKETTWDRITGPKLFKVGENILNKKSNPFFASCSILSRVSMY